MGGHFLPISPKIVCHFHVDCAKLTKFLDFLSFNVRHVPEKSVSWKINKRCQKYPKGGPFYAKIKDFKKKIFFQKSYFFYLKINYIWIELSFEVYNSLLAQNFAFSSFFAWKIQSLIYHVSMALASYTPSN